MAQPTSKQPLALPPLADSSPKGRAFRASTQRVKEFSALLTKGLKSEFKPSADAPENIGLDESRIRLEQVVERLIRSTAEIADRGESAKLLDICHDLMFACADAASRIDHKLLPRTARRHGGQISGEVRAKAAADAWVNNAVDLANEIRARNPHHRTPAIANAVEEQWEQKFGTTLPVTNRRLLDVLRKCRKKDGTFEKPHT